MHSSVSQKTVMAARTHARSDSESMINKEFRKGYEMPILTYQQFGIQAKMLWPTRNQILRIIPGYDPETGEVFKQNINGEGGWDDSVPMTDYLPDTFTAANTLSSFGLLSSPIITDYKPGSDDAEQWGATTVISAFCKNIKNAVAAAAGTLKWKLRFCLKPGKNWSAWCGFNPDKGIPVVGLPKLTFMMQALVFQLNGRDNMTYETKEPLTDENGDIAPLLYVVCLDHKKSAEALQTALVKPQNRNLPLDAATNNEYGPMAEASGYKLFLNTCTDPATGYQMLKPSVQAGSRGWTPTPYDLTEDEIHAFWHPWEKLLHFMTAREQLELCAASFGADTVNYVLGTDPAMRDLEIPEEIKAVGLGQYASLDKAQVSGGRIELQTPAAAAKHEPVAALRKQPTAQATQTTQPVSEDRKLSGVTTASGVDMDKLRANVAKIRAASGLSSLKKVAPAVDQADEAARLLQDEDITPFDR